MKKIEITLSYDADTMELRATTELTGYVAALPDRAVAGTQTDSVKLNTLADQVERQKLMSALSKSLNAALVKVGNFNTAAGVLTEAAELLGAPAPDPVD